MPLLYKKFLQEDLHLVFSFTGIFLYRLGTTYQSTFRQRTDSVTVPLVSHAEYQLFTISKGGRVSFQEEDNNDRGRWDELQLPDGELGEQIQRKYLNKDRVILNVLRTMRGGEDCRNEVLRCC